MITVQNRGRDSKPRSGALSYFSLFTSVGTLLCCALPSLLVLLGLGASVATMLSFMPWLVTLSHHKAWVFAASGVLILLSFVQMYGIAPKFKAQQEACAPDDLTCDRATRVSKGLLWIATSIYLIGFFTAYILGSILTRLDRG
jgi:mercuric ion transport protein